MSAYRTSYAVLMCLLAVGCAAPEVVPAYVGKLTDPGQDAAVGVVSDGLQISAYVCGGPTTYDTLSRWFKGAVRPDGTFALQKTGFALTGDLHAGTGQLATDTGETLAWAVHPTDNDQEGLYAAMDGSCRTGAVLGDLDGDGTVRLQGAWCHNQAGGGDEFAQVSPLTPASLVTDRGIAVEVLIDPMKSLFVEQVLAP